MTCEFCKLFKISARIAHKDNFVISFLSWTPITEGHTIVAPIRHVSKISALSPAEWENLRVMILKVSSALKSLYRCAGFNYAWNDGAIAGQSVPHLHFHIVPRYDRLDRFGAFSPRALLYGCYPNRPRWSNAKLSRLAASLAKKIE